MAITCIQSRVMRLCHKPYLGKIFLRIPEDYLTLCCLLIHYNDDVSLKACI